MAGTILGKGAEAEIILENDIVIKRRVRKGYRIRQLDDPLRKSRTRREAKVMEKLPPEIGRPELIRADDSGMEIRMSLIRGPKVRDILDDNVGLAEEIGEIAALMHNSGIIHGDLTTSNMIYNPEEKKIYLIDFGLSFFSQKEEDKAVDLHLLKQALESRHYRVWEKAFSLVITGYRRKSAKAKEILDRLEIVESRGRNKEKS